MNFKTGLGALAFAAAVALGGQAAAATITSTFDTGTDGWGYSTWQGVGGSKLPVTYDAVGGLITSTYGFGGYGYVAPDKFLGDKSAFIGGSLSFDLSSAFNNYSGQRPLVVLSGVGDKRVFANWAPGPTNQLQTFTISLNASSFYTGGDTKMGPPASAQQFQEVMADLRQIEIWGDWTPNVDTTKLDNVVMTSAAAVPEPATWAMMILGFGATGVLMRRRRAVAAFA